jgi:succinate-acetate transporter protein
MVIARTMILNLTNIFVYVHRALMALNASMIIGLVNQILAGMTVYKFVRSTNRNELSSF